MTIEKLEGIEYGCVGADVCNQGPPCTVGKCVDLWNARKCECEDDQSVTGGCGDAKRRDRIDPIRDREKICGDLSCRNGGTLICEKEENGNVTAPWCNCTTGYLGVE